MFMFNISITIILLHAKTSSHMIEWVDCISKGWPRHDYAIHHKKSEQISSNYRSHDLEQISYLSSVRMPVYVVPDA